MNKDALLQWTLQTQLRAYPSDEIEIGANPDPTHLPDKGLILKHIKKDELLNIRFIKWLKYQNVNHHHIYIRPKAPHALTLVDDLSLSGIQAMQDNGFQPALTIETSPNNYQVWLNNGQTMANEQSTIVAKYFAEKFNGDPSSADYRHFGRLAGFTNCKPKYRRGAYYPFTRIIEKLSTFRPYTMANEIVAWAEQEHNKQLAKPKLPPPTDVIFSTNNLKTVHDFYNDSRYANDAHRADLAYAIYALNRSIPPQAIAAALAQRDLSKKGSLSRQNDYIERTIEKASRLVDI